MTGPPGVGFATDWQTQGCHSLAHVAPCLVGSFEAQLKLGPVYSSREAVEIESCNAGDYRKQRHPSDLSSWGRPISIAGQSH
jgi:hypothetical protein